MQFLNLFLDTLHRSWLKIFLDMQIKISILKVRIPTHLIEILYVQIKFLRFHSFLGMGI